MSGVSLGTTASAPIFSSTCRRDEAEVLRGGHGSRLEMCMVQVQALAPCVVCCSQTTPASTAVLWHKGAGTRSSSIQTLLACITFVAPVMTLDTCGFLMHHASASCRGLAQGVHTTPTHGAAARTVQPGGSTLRAHASPARQENGSQGSQLQGTMQPLPAPCLPHLSHRAAQLLCQRAQAVGNVDFVPLLDQL